VVGKRDPRFLPPRRGGTDDLRGFRAGPAHREEISVFLEEKGRLVPASGLKERMESPVESVLTFQHGGFHDAGAFPVDLALVGVVPLATSAEVGLAVMSGGSPDVVPVGALEL